MGIGSGLGAQLGLAEETTVGTIVAPSRFLEFNSEGLELSKNIVQGQGLRAGGQYNRASRRSYTTRSAGGPINLDVPTIGAGLLFKHMLGGTPVVAQQGATTAWKQTHKPGELTGKSLTVQKGVPQTDGTVKPFTYRGAKVASWELGCTVGDILKLALTLDAWDETTATALGVAAYSPSANIFHFAQGSVVLGGTVATAGGVATLTGGTTVAAIKSATVTGTNPMATDRYFFGSSGVKAEQVENDYRTAGGSLAGEFVNQATIYDLFAADTRTSLNLKFVGPQIVTGQFFTLDVLLPAIYFDGESPKVGGPEIVNLDAGFTALDDGSNATVQISYTSTDTAP